MYNISRYGRTLVVASANCYLHRINFKRSTRLNVLWEKSVQEQCSTNCLHFFALSLPLLKASFHILNIMPCIKNVGFVDRQT